MSEENKLQGAFVYNDENNNVDVFLYMIMENHELKELLPHDYDHTGIEDHNTLCMLIQQGKDYIASNNIERVLEIINENMMVSLLDNDYQQILNKGIRNLESEHHEKMMKFVNNQLKNHIIKDKK